jgi:UDPglucose--hexose-1-phosphate uridylyltransferase
MKTYPHRRRNALNGDWVLVSPHRTERPWLGQVEKKPPETRPAYDPDCYLCPGNQRAGGVKNPPYTGTFVFTNDFAALLPEAPPADANDHTLLHNEDMPGTCRVLCFSPRHDLTLAEMSLPEIRVVVDLWAQQTQELGQKYTWVQVFENKGAMMGSSNPHPHGQIWASAGIPLEPGKEDRQQEQYFSRYGQPLLLDYARLEADREARQVEVNDHWLALVPYWAVWPFETLLLPLQSVQRLPDLADEQRTALADILKRLLTRYDQLFDTSFPYSMGWHGAPYPTAQTQHWQLHAHFFPPLLRSATVKKFMVGYEMLAEPQRDLTPEQAAARLRELPGYAG